MLSKNSLSIPIQFDVLVIGSGAAGLYSALCLPPNLRVGIVTKDAIDAGSSNWAQGGIAAAIHPSDSPIFHLEDTLKAGAGLCRPEAVKFLVKNASESIASLVEMGVDFDRHGDQLAATLEAAHSHPRVLHSADTTGRAIIDTLRQQVLDRDNIHVLSHAFTLSLWLHPQTSRCQGIRCLYQNQIQWVRANAVILATGGGGQVFSQTTNPSVCTADGLAMAWRSGAMLRDLEFYQFHPTALSIPGAPRFLISEAVRGEGAHLMDQNGDRFAFKYHPDGELAPRDVVSRAIFSHLQHCASGNPTPLDHVYLDLSPIDPERIRYRFPKIIQVCRQWGVDVFKDPIPVAPAAHYWMGGIAVNLMGETSIAGLYAMGETASTGVHGANRLASNSLLECIVFAAQLAKIQIDGEGCDRTDTSDQTSSQPTAITVESDWTDDVTCIMNIRKQLPQLMWNHAGVYRHKLGLQEAKDQVQAWQADVQQLAISHYVLQLVPNQTVPNQTVPNQTVRFSQANAGEQLQQAMETLNLLTAADLILSGAMLRHESRGGHHRLDHPDTSDEWQVHTMTRNDEVWTTPITVDAFDLAR